MEDKKAFLYTAIVAVFLFLLSNVIYFFNLRTETLELDLKEKNVITNYFSSTFKESVFLNEYEKTDLLLHTYLLGTESLNNIQIEYKKLFITRDALLTKANADLKNQNILIADVTTDAKIGTILQLSKDIYIFKPTKNFKQSDVFRVRFQMMQEGVIQSKLVAFRFYSTENIKKLGDIKNRLAAMSESLGFGKRIELKNESLKYQFQEYAKLSYTIDRIKLLNSAGESFNSFLLNSFLFFLSISVLFLAVYTYLKKYLQEQMYIIYGYLNNNVVALLNEDFQNIDTTKLQSKELLELSRNIVKISKKISTTINEKNIAQNILAKRDITDDLTGLPNNKSFEKDIKQMFIMNSNGYVGYFKIDGLGRYTKENGSEEINSLISDFAHKINNFLRKSKAYDAIIYRFYGAVFGFVIYNHEPETIKNMMEDVVKIAFSLHENYYFFDNDIHYGLIPFDKYGTVESILSHATLVYEDAKNKDKSYIISDNSIQLEKDLEHEKSVKDIIQREDFALRYIFDTYSMDENERLLMQEISPLLMDTNTFEKFSTGVFISVAEKLNLAVTFDKILIQKALEQLKMNPIEHKLAINISISSFGDTSFISWLSSILLYNENADKIVIAVGHHAAIANKNEFKKMADILHEYKSEILLKRYDLNEYNEEFLQYINPDYIRIEREFTHSVAEDNSKQHLIKKIILFAEANNIKVFGDNVKNENDYKIIKRLTFHGTSR